MNAAQRELEWANLQALADRLDVGLTRRKGGWVEVESPTPGGFRYINVRGLVALRRLLEEREADHANAPR